MIVCRSAIIALLLFSIPVKAQQVYEGRVLDAHDKSPLPYCALAVYKTSYGTLSNEDGKFVISLKPGDTLIFQHPGYATIKIAGAVLANDATILLQPQGKQLAEVNIYSDDDWLYDELQKCRQFLGRSPDYSSKAYFTLNSAIGRQPVELIECYYNSVQNASSLKKMVFKNGRAGGAQYGKRYFMNLNTSKVFTSINLLGGHAKMPHSPFEYDKRQMKKKFKLAVIETSAGENPICHLSFKPKHDTGNYYKGEVWIQKNTGKIRSLSMSCGPTDTHPFLPLFPNGSILGVSMEINKVFSEEGLPEHIDFVYTIKYQHRQSKTVLGDEKDTTFSTKCKGFVYFYDYGKSFYEPQISYNHEMDDYRKIALLSINEEFWDLNKGPVYSNTMVEAVKYFKKYGDLINYSNVSRGDKEKKRKIFEENYIHWSRKKRLAVKSDHIVYDTLFAGPAGPIHDHKFNLKAQIFMDINETPDSLQYCTATVFDIYNSFFDLNQDENTRAFINIFFDIYEINRIKLEEKLKQKNITAAEALKYYKEAMTEADRTSNLYLDEARMGDDKTKLMKWNEYVIANLGIDNIEVCKKPEAR